MSGPYRSIYAPDLFAGQTVVITGGGSGIGRCTAHELASLGALVVLVGRTASKLETVQAEIADDGGRAATAVLDIRVEDDVRRVVGELVAAHGPIHGLVNNAGGQFPAPLTALSQNAWETVIRTNLTGGFLMSREVFLQTMSEHGGSIVNVVADMFRGMPTMGHSGAARAGMVNLTETAAVEWASAGVRVNSVAPGVVASSGLDAYTDPRIRSTIPHFRRKVPMQRLAEEAEIASAITYLLSPGAAYVTGECIRVDGGQTLNARPLPFADHDRSTPYQGFHRAVMPEILREHDAAASAGD